MIFMQSRLESLRSPWIPTLSLVGMTLYSILFCFGTLSPTTGRVRTPNLLSYVQVAVCGGGSADRGALGFKRSSCPAHSIPISDYLPRNLKYPTLLAPVPTRTHLTPEKQSTLRTPLGRQVRPIPIASRNHTAKTDFPRRYLFG
jgi:hypothetical protein